MRIIPDLIRCPDCKFFTDSDCKASTTPCPVNQPIEISDTQLNWIHKTYEDMGMNWFRSNGVTNSISSKPSFAVWFRALISLTGEGK